jgi:hypothetical protein
MRKAVASCPPLDKEGRTPMRPAHEQRMQAVFRLSFANPAKRRIIVRPPLLWSCTPSTNRPWRIFARSKSV